MEAGTGACMEGLSGGCGGGGRPKMEAKKFVRILPATVIERTFAYLYPVGYIYSRGVGVPLIYFVFLHFNILYVSLWRDARGTGMYGDQFWGRGGGKEGRSGREAAGRRQGGDFDCCVQSAFYL